MARRRIALALAAALCGCPRPDTCNATLEKQEVWSSALDWYLYQDLLPATVDPALYGCLGLVDVVTIDQAI